MKQLTTLESETEGVVWRETEELFAQSGRRKAETVSSLSECSTVGAWTTATGHQRGHRKRHLSRKHTGTHRRRIGLRIRS